MDKPKLVLKNSGRENKRAHRINNEIVASKVRILGSEQHEDGTIIYFSEAIELAEDLEIDLVMISDGEIPVCRLIAYDKFCYELSKRNKPSHSKKQKQVKFHPSIASNDIEHKIKHIREFIEDGHRVEVVCQFKGRENTHKEFGYKLFDKIQTELTGAKRDGDVRQAGNTISMYLVRK